ncbi:hypothetical protein AAL_05799 [Moelleriella libera RCEF 2490]|uniref:Uncharacterized protein n=1 Tax=Moelleriella libera RCEF 2490 TaxID=1081109 RepID=A0A168A3C7_9HYPO|nr:hypothetical protein AAL_05799 [Moelleriella libera RCEF 2490]
MEQEQQAHHFKRLLQEILLFEKTSCPFLRPFKAVLPNTIMSESNGRQTPGQAVDNLVSEEDNCVFIEQMPGKRLEVRSGHPRDASWKNTRNIQAPMGWAMPSAATYEHAQCDSGTDHRIKKRPQIVFSRTIMRQQEARLEPLPFYHFNCVKDTLSRPNMWSVRTKKGNEQFILLSDDCTEMSHSVSDLSSCLQGSVRRSSRRDHLRRHSSRSTSRPPETSQMLNLQESDGRAVSEDITENSSLLKAMSQGFSHCGIIVMTSSAQASDLCGRPKKIGSPEADFSTQSGLTSSIKQVVHHPKGEYRKYDRTTMKGQIIKLGYLPLAIMNKTYDISMKSPGMLVEMMRKAAGMVCSQGDCQGLRHSLPGRMIPVRWDHSTLGVRDWGIEDPGRQFMT